MRIYDIKNALAQAVAASGMRALPFMPDSVSEAVFCVGEVEIIPPRGIEQGARWAFGDRWYGEFSCYLIVGGADDRASQQRLDQLLSPTEPTSAIAAIEAARGAPGQPALGGLASDLSVLGISGYKIYTIGVSQHYGAVITVGVWGLP